MLKSSISLEPKASTLEDIPLLHALEWVAFELVPLDVDYDMAFRSEHRDRKDADPQYIIALEQAKKPLFIALKEGHLGVSAKAIDTALVPDASGRRRSRAAHAPSSVKKEIMPAMWGFDHILWDECALEIHDRQGTFFNDGEGWYFAQEIAVKASDLFKIFPPSKQGTNILSHVKEPEYLPYYMALMQNAIKELKITPENQPLKKVLIEWFLKQDSKLSARGVEAMATLVRLPEKKKGGWHAHKG